MGGGGLFGLDSPLQRMASITNSLVSQPLPSPHFNQRPLKAVLPPITQQQVPVITFFYLFLIKYIFNISA
jgi:hypothetical protein